MPRSIECICYMQVTIWQHLAQLSYTNRRLSISDHPWLDCFRDLRELLQPARLAALEADARNLNVDSGSCTRTQRPRLASPSCERVTLTLGSFLAVLSHESWNPVPGTVHTSCDMLSASMKLEHHSEPYALQSCPKGSPSVA